MPDSVDHRWSTVLVCLLLSLTSGVAPAQGPSNEEVLFFDGRPDQTGTANGGAVIFPLGTGISRWWFQGVRGARVSPNALQVAYFYSDVLHVVDFGGQSPTVLLSTGTAPDLVSWNPSGDRLAFYSNATGFSTYNLDVVDLSGTLVFRKTLEVAATAPPAWSPDGSRIAFTERVGGGHRVSCVDLLTGDVTVLHDPPIYNTPEEVYYSGRAYFPVWLSDGRIGFHLDSRVAEFIGGKWHNTVTVGIATMPGTGGDPDWAVDWTYEYDDGDPGPTPGFPGVISTLAASPSGASLAFSIAAGELPQGIYSVSSSGGPATFVNGFVPGQAGGARGHLQWIVLNPNPLVVNDDGDEADADPSDGVIDTDLGTAGFQVTLRAAIEAGNAIEGLDTITFDIPGGGTPVIAPQTPLPVISADLTIDGTTQPGSGCVRIQGGSSVPIGLSALNSTVELMGLSVTECSEAGIDINGGSESKVEGCLIGTDASGTSGLGNGIGIRIRNTTDGTIGSIDATARNVISGNTSGIDAAAATGLLIASNFIGVAPDGSTPMSTTTTGIIADNCLGLKIGIEEAASVINASVGIDARNIAPGGSESIGAIVKNIHFNLDEPGTGLLGTWMQTALCADNVRNLTIGGTSENSQNAIGATQQNAVEILNSLEVSLNAIRIGMNRPGTQSFPVLGTGLLIDNSPKTTVSGASAGGLHGSINALAGILVRNTNPDPGVPGVTIQGMHFNLDPAGLTKLSELMQTAVCVENSRNVTIGGVDDTLHNVFAGMQQNAVEILNCLGVEVKANLIGTDRPGVQSFPVLGKGMLIDNSPKTTISGASAGGLHGSINALAGILVRNTNPDPGVPGVTVQGYNFNLNPAGLAQFSELMQTAFCAENCSDVTVGGVDDTLHNVFAGMQQNAVEILNCLGVEVKANLIGTDRPGVQSFPVLGKGMLVDNSPNTTVSGVSARGLHGSINALAGILVRNIDPDPGVPGVTVQGYNFNLGPDGAAKLSDFMQTALCLDNCSSATVGGPESTMHNVFAGMQGNALEVLNCLGVDVKANLIGMDRPGAQSFPVLGTGMLIDNSPKTTVSGASGGGLNGAINAVAGLLLRHINPDPGTPGVTVEGYNFNLDPTGLAKMSNFMQTALCVEDSSKVSAGSALIETVNAIGATSGNAVESIRSSDIEITGNRIGVARTGETAFATGGNSIFVDGPGSEVSITGNAIQNAIGAGVNITTPGTNVVVRQNRIINCVTSIQRAFHQSSSAISSAGRGSTHVDGTVSGSPGETLTIDFYAYNPSATSPELDLFIGTEVVVLDGGGVGTYDVSFPTTAPLDWLLTTTVTSDLEGTTELSVPLAIAPPLDTDGDGFPDDYEDQYQEFLNAAVWDDPDDDFDRDGVSDGDEYELGTNPSGVDGGLVQGTLRTESGFDVDVEAVSGRRYSLNRWVETPAPGSWTPITSTFVSLSGPLTLTDASPPPLRGIYRVESEVE